MIESVDEYKRWFDSAESVQRGNKLRQEARIETWQAIVDQFAECRAAVARNPTVPHEVLRVLRYDDDEAVRWWVRTNKRWLEQHPEDACPWLDDPANLVQFRLSPDERRVLRCGLRDWGGPTRCTEELARAMGFGGVSDLLAECTRIGVALRAEEPLSRTDWTRALLATEIVFMSRVVGSGPDWTSMTGFDDTQTLSILRGLQRKLVTGGVVGVAFGTCPTPTSS